MTAELLPTPSVDHNGAPVCELCGQPINPTAIDTLCLVLGWVVNRSGGGAHAVSDRRDLGRYRHGPCHRYGDQTALF